MILFRISCSAIAAVTLVTATTTARSEDWPTKAVQVISPFSAGNANDTVARVVLDQVSRQIAQPFIIENWPGGGGTIGVAMVTNADPDGYTILLHSSSVSAQVVLHKTLPYDPVRELAPVVLFGVQPSVLVSAPSKGFKTVADLVAAAKARPGELNFASAGIGSASHMAGERLRLAAGINVQHTPFRGAEGLGAVLAGMDRLLFHPDCAGGPADRRRQAGGAGGKHAEAGAVLAKRTDDSGSGLSGCRVSVLGRIVRAGEDPALYRRQAAR